MNEMIKLVTGIIKKLCSLRKPPYELPADSHIDGTSGEIIKTIFGLWQWIPVKVMLPPNDGKYLLLAQQRINIGIFYKGSFYKGRTPRRYYDSWLTENKKYKAVTHWMPLPPIPEKE